jgi:hypothetical protein
MMATKTIAKTMEVATTTEVVTLMEITMVWMAVLENLFLSVLKCCFEYLKTLGFVLNQIEAKMQKL